MNAKRFHILFLSVSLSGVLFQSLPARNNAIRIVQADTRGLVLEYTPSFLTPTKENINSSEYTRYKIEGGVPLKHQKISEPQLIMQTFIVRLPGERNNTIELMNAEYETIANVILAPAVNVKEIDNAAYQRNGFFPPQIVSLENVGETQGAVLGEVQISPLQYDPGQRLLRKYSKIVIRINFGNAEPLRFKPQKLVRGLALNDETFSGNPIQQRQTSTRQNSVLASGAWFRFDVSDDGMYKITGRQLLDAGVSASVDPKTIQIFSNGGYELPADPMASFTDDLVENAVYLFDADSIGQLNPNDYIIFYGKGTRGWKYNPAQKTFSHYLNHFSESNVYWLTYGSTVSKKMVSDTSLNQILPIRPMTTTGKLFREDEKINILGSGLEWVGQPLNSAGYVVYTHQLSGVDVSKQIHYRFHIGARSSTSSVFAVDEHGSRILNLPLSGTDVDGPDFYGYSQFVSSVKDIFQNTPSDGRSLLRFSFSTSSEGGVGYIDWYEVFYRQMLITQNNAFNFHSEDTSGVVEYAMSGFSDAQRFIFDVTKFDSVIRITNSRNSSDTCAFQVQQSPSYIREYYAVGQSGFKATGTFTPVANQNLRGDTTNADYIIITHRDFLTAAQRLKTHRENDSLHTVVVGVDSVYNEFGGGIQSPEAIRNYLRYLYTTASKPPQYVLLFGDGDFDYKRILTTGPNWIPPWETTESFVPISSYASDDNFAIFDDSNRVKFGLGRLTARSLQEANTMVDKIIEYETKPISDPWKLRLSFVADDGWAGPSEDDGFVHTDQAEAISRLAPSLFEKRKIYLYEYPTVFTSEGRRKPAVNEAIVSQINQGTLLLNFTGHGNPQLWAHEHVFVRETDFPLLSNKGKYFFLVAATCNFSNFDAIGEQSGGEILASLSDAGAIAVLSATRAVYSFDNYLFNQTVYQNLFQTDLAGRVLPQRLGDIVYRTKQTRISDNDRKYFLLGDPALRFGFPKMYASIDTLNGLSLNLPVQLKALSQDTLTARVSGNFTGQAQLVIYDAKRSFQINDPNNGTRSYIREGNILYKGEVSVNSGEVKASFVVPKDISYSDTTGRVVLYFWNNLTDGAGYTTNVRIGGTDSTAQTDNAGPTIRLYVDGRTFRPGDIVSAVPLLIADLSDQHGINTSDVGVGHRIEAWLDNSPQSIDMTNYYKSNIDSYQNGSAQYRFNNIAQGAHTIRVRAWDTYNNPAMDETNFDVVTGTGLQVTSVYNYPNPFSSSTVFTFQHNQLVSVDAEVKIYTVAGRMIQSLKRTGLIDRPTVAIPWDGRDKDGDILANGVYLYKVIVTTTDSRFSSEAYGKISVLR